MDLLNPCAPVFDADLAAAIRGLQKHPGPLMQGPCLLSGLTKQQHAWHINNAGMLSHSSPSLSSPPQTTIDSPSAPLFALTSPLQVSQPKLLALTFAIIVQQG